MCIKRHVTKLFTALLFVIAKTLEMTQRSNNSKMDKLWHTHTIEQFNTPNGWTTAMCIHINEKHNLV